MDLIDRIKSIGERFEKTKEIVTTEEATKNAFIMPFIQALGYDVFDPMEVVPEFTADVALKKGEKVDYCIMQDNHPIIIIECKHWKEKLDNHDSQLVRYFHVTDTRFAILTNGLEYRFYTDLDDSNKMDSRPFFEFKANSISELQIEELKKFTKQLFDVSEILSNASDLKYSKAIKELLSQELKNPSDDFIKYITGAVYSGRITQKVQEQFAPLIQKSFKLLMSEMISDKLKIAMSSESEEQEVVQEEIQQEEEKASNDGIVTTEEELQGYRIVQAILLPHITADRVFYRDAKTYFSVLLDDNNRKTICRLHLNRSKKYLGVFDENKKENKILIETLEDIYSHSDKIKDSLDRFLDS